MIATKQFLPGITDLHFSLYSNSWGNCQCTAKTYNDKTYYAWPARADYPLKLKDLLWAIKSIDKQIKEGK